MLVVLLLLEFYNMLQRSAFEFKLAYLPKINNYNIHKQEIGDYIYLRFIHFFSSCANPFMLDGIGMMFFVERYGGTSTKFQRFDRSI